MNYRNRMAELARAQEVEKLRQVTSNVSIQPNGDIRISGLAEYMILDQTAAELVYDGLRELFEPEPPTYKESK